MGKLTRDESIKVLVNIGTIGHFGMTNKFPIPTYSLKKSLSGRGKGNKYEARRIRGW